MSQPTEDEIERGVAALLPFAQEWGLPLNPEDLQAMAVAVLTHADSDEAFEQIDAAERRWIRQDREAHQRIVTAIGDAPPAHPHPVSGPDGLSEEQLAAIEGRVAAASSGPWESFVEGRDHDSGDSFIRTGGVHGDGPDLYIHHGFADRAPIVVAPVADQDFIAHARQDIPRLVAEVRRLRGLAA